MGNFWIAAGAVLPLMIYMGVGLLAKKRYGFTPQIISYFNKLVFGVFLPTNMFYSVYFTDVSKVVKPSFVGLPWRPCCWNTLWVSSWSPPW